MGTIGELADGEDGQRSVEGVVCSGRSDRGNVWEAGGGDCFA